MKQTNNAIKFLMAQYRAIFKNAYFKGLTTAVALTATMAASQASEATPDFEYQHISNWANGTYNSTEIYNGNITHIVGKKAIDKDSTVSITDANLTLNTTNFTKFTTKENAIVAGAYMLKSGGDVSATTNKLIIEKDFQFDNLSGGLVYGAVANANHNNGTGKAVVSGNELTLNISKSKETFKQFGNKIFGGSAQSKNYSEALGNIVTISGTDAIADTKATLKAKIFGGYAITATDTTEGTFIASGNKVDINNVALQFSDSIGAKNEIIGGGAYYNPKSSDTKNTANLIAQNNTVILNNIKFGLDTDEDRNTITANHASGKSGSALSAIGTEGETSLKITNSKIFGSDIHGGIAIGAVNSNAKANLNSVHITDTTLELSSDTNHDKNNFIHGGRVVGDVSGTNSNPTFSYEANNNKVIIDNTQATDNTDTDNLSVLKGHAYGGSIFLTQKDKATLDNISLQANNNSLTIGKGVNVTLSGDGLYGASIKVQSGNSILDASETKIEAQNNSITIDGIVQGTTDKDSIYAANVRNSKHLSLNNDVLVNGKVINVHQITGGAGKDSSVEFNAGSTLEVKADSATNTTIISDVVKLAGNVDITDGKTVTVQGYYTNGLKQDSNQTYNPNQTTVASTANIQNAGSLIFKGYTTVDKDAKLHATNDKALIIVSNENVDADLSGNDTDWNDPKKFNILYGNGGFVGGTATLNIHESTLKSYLTAGDEYNAFATQGSLSKDKAGTVQVTSGGVLEFADKEVKLSDYAFVAGETAEKGKIQVDDAITVSKDVITKGSIFRADNITLEHQLVNKNSTTDTGYDITTESGRNALLTNTNGVDSDGIIIQTKNLTLGSNGLTDAQSRDISFGYADVTESVNFVNTVSTNADNKGKPAAFELAANINLDAKTKVVTKSDDPLLRDTAQRDELGNFVYFTPNEGKINGDVLLTYVVSGTSTTGSDDDKDDVGILHAKNGNWTATGNVAMESGSKIFVGNDGTDGLDTDATLTLANGLTLHSNTGDDQEIIVRGDDQANPNETMEYDFDVAALHKEKGEFYKHLALLDLRKGINVVTTDSTKPVSGTATIKATSGGVVLLNGGNLSDVLAKNVDDTSSAEFNNKGVTFAAEAHGKFVVEGTLTADFNDFLASDAETNATGIKLSSVGILETEKLILAHKNTGTNIQDETHIKSAENTISLEGIVRANDLEINDTTVTTKKSGTESVGSYASSVRVATGKIYLSNSLSSVNNTLILGDAKNTKKATLTLATDKVQDKGSINVKNIKVEGKDSSINVLNGDWTAENTAFTLASGSYLAVGNEYGSSEDSLDNETYASLTAKSLTAEAGSLVKVGSDGTLTLTTADFGKQAAADLTTQKNGIFVKGNMTILGDASLVDKDGKDVTHNGMVFGKEGSIVVKNSGHLKFGSAATTGAILADNVVESAKEVTLEKGYSKIDLQGGEVELGLKDSVFSAEAVLDLKKKLFTTGSFINGTTPILANGGVLNIGDATFKGLKVTDDGDGTYSAKWEDIKNWSDITNNQIADVTNNQLGKTDVTNVSVTDEVRGHYGSITMDSSSASSNAKVQIVGDASLRYSAGNNGYFISNADDTVAAGAIISSGKILKLIDGGKIGDVVLNEGVGDNTLDDYTILQFEGKGENTVASITGESTSTNIDNNNTLVNVLSKTTVTGDIKNIDEVNVDSTLTVSGNMVANELSVNGKQASVIADTKDTKTTLDAIYVEGGQAVFHNLELNGTTPDIYGYTESHYIYNGGLVKVNNELVLNNSTTDFVLHVGADKSDFSQADLEAGLTGTGLLEANVVELNKSTIFVDPEYNQKSSLVAINQFKTKGATTSTRNLGQIDGQLAIGKNAAMGLGSNLETLEQAISRYQNAGSLDAKKYGSILYLNGQVELMDGATIAIDSNELNKSILDVRKSVLTYKDADGKLLDIDMGLGANTALIISDQAFANDKGQKTETAFHFNKKGATVYSNGGDIVLQGSFNTAEKLNIFTDNDAAAGQSGSGIKLVGKDINIFTENGFMFGTIKVGDDVGYNVGLTVDKDKAYNIMHEASDPVVETLIAYGTRGSAPQQPSKPDADDNKPTDNPEKPNNGGSIDVVGGNNTQMTELTPAKPIAQEKPDTPVSDKPETIEPSTPVTTVLGSSEFLDAVITTTNGAPAETVARLGVYGGAAQAAIKAGASSYEAILGHMGIGGQSANLYSASNGQSGNVWVSPVYVNSDSDSFDAQGLSYGVDMNLFGLALGGEFNLNNNVRFGAMFNVGSGDADGKGNVAAASVSNDFNYYGFGAYVGFTQDKLSVVADVSYTLVDNDIKGKTNLGDVNADLDSKNFSLGVTGQYELDLNGISVIPHASLRYTNIDLDNYSIKGNNEEIANYSADKMSIFSVPVGVTFAKVYEGESWTVKPSVDFTLTGNFGDDSSDGSVMWTGTDLKTNTATEVIDTFTYGVSAGLSAQTGSFVMGVGINYSGSSNVSDFGINANARFMF